MPDAVMTYATLKSDLASYVDRSDPSFVLQVPRLIMLAEFRIAEEVRGLGYLKFVTAALSINNPTLVKPTDWRQTISFQLEVGSRRVFLRPRTLEYCRVYWPQGATASRQPKYYADYDFGHYYLAPTPDAAYPVEIGYHQKPTPLSDSNQENWTTKHAPNVLLYAALMEAAIFRKRWEEKAGFEADYNRVASVLAREDQLRLSDRQVSAKEGE